MYSNRFDLDINLSKPNLQRVWIMWNPNNNVGIFSSSLLYILNKSWQPDSLLIKLKWGIFSTCLEMWSRRKKTNVNDLQITFFPQSKIQF